MLLGAKLGDLESKLGYQEVVFKLNWAILLGHVVAFASKHALPQQDKGLKWLSASDVGSVWCHLRANFNILGLCRRLYGIILDHVTSACSKTTPNYTLSPMALEA